MVSTLSTHVTYSPKERLPHVSNSFLGGALFEHARTQCWNFKTIYGG
jgi:hypothetical protein